MESEDVSHTSHTLLYNCCDVYVYLNRYCSNLENVSRI